MNSYTEVEITSKIVNMNFGHFLLWDNSRIGSLVSRAQKAFYNV